MNARTLGMLAAVLGILHASNAFPSVVSRLGGSVQLLAQTSQAPKVVSTEAAKKALELAKACIAKSPEAYRSVGGTPLQLEKATFTSRLNEDLVMVHIPEERPRQKPQGVAIDVNLKTGACRKLNME